MRLLAGRPVVVAGAGVGGAGAALLLANAGAGVTLLERVPEPKAAGAGILLQPNGLAVLYGLGLRDVLGRHGARVAAGAVVDAAGAPIMQTPVPDFGDGLDHMLVIRRSRLLAALLDAAAAHPGITCRFGTELVAASADGHVTYRSDDGTRTVSADLVVGADGVHSCVRTCGAFAATVSAGPSYVRGLAPPTALDGMAEHWTPLGIFGAGRVDGATYFYASTAAPPLAAALAARDLGALASTWRRHCPVAGEAFAGVARFEDLLVNEVIRVDCERFVDGRLLLLGDAAHAMAPNLGQGANSALVDGAVLAWELGQGPDLAAALGRYDRRRRRAVRMVQDLADRIAWLSDLTHPLVRWTRDNLARLVLRVVPAARGVRAAQQEDPAWLQRVVRGRT